MAEDLSNDFLYTGSLRNTGKVADMQARLDKLAEMEQAAAPAAAAPAAPAVKPAAQKSPSVIAEGIKAIGGGVYDAAKNTINLVDDAATWMDNNFLDLRIGSSTFGRKPAVPHKATLQVPDAPQWAQNETGAGKVVRSITQFAVPFVGALKAARYAAPLAGKVGANVAVQGAAAGAAADFAAFDPHDQRLSNLLLDWTDNDPMFGKAAMEYLRADPKDSAMEGRFKNALEGLGIGVAVEGVFKAVKAGRSYFQAKGVDPAKAIDTARGARTEAPMSPQELDLQRQVEVLAGRAPKTPEQVADTILQKPGATKLELAPTTPPKADGIDFPAKAPVVDVPTQLRLVEDVVKKGGARSPKLAADGSIVFSKEAPAAGEQDLEQIVTLALAKPGFERSATDVAALRAYRQMQEAAFPGIIVPARASDEAIQIVEVAGTGRRAISHKLRKEIREGAEAAPAVELKATAKGTTKKATEPIEMAVGDEVSYNGGDALGLVKSIRPDGRVVVEDVATGATKTVTPDVADPVLADIMANSAKINKTSRRAQAGHISPAVLANMAAGSVGAAAGFTSADDDASFAEKLSLAFGGALAGMGIKAGAVKALSAGERAVVTASDPLVKSLSHPALRNIAPMVAVAKKAPVIARAKVDEMVAAARDGGYKALAESVKKSDFNFDHIDTPDDVKQMIDAFSSVFEKETTLAKHGTQSFDDMRELAEELGAGKQSLQALATGTDNLGARILAHRALLAASAEKVTSLARIVNDGVSGVRTEDAIISLRKHVAMHAAVQAQMKGVQTEVARALAQFRIQSSSVDLATNEINQLVDSLGGHAANIKFARELQAITDPKGLNLAIRRGAMARTQSAIVESVVLGKLWSPTTHVANAVGNMITAVGSLAERQAASLSGRFLRSAPDAIQQGEVKAQLFGMIAGVRDALRITSHGFKAARGAAGKAAALDFSGARATLSENANEFGSAWQALGTGAPVGRSTLGGTVEDINLVPAISATAAGLDPKSILGHLADYLGTATRIPGHALAAADELFFTLHNRGELHALAYREAAGKGLEGQQFIDEVARLIDDPTPSMSSRAQRAGQDGTFTTPLTGGQKKISDLINESAAIGPIPVGRMIVPFVRTPMNIMNYVGQRMPLVNRMGDSYKAAMAEGGAAADLARAKTATGSMLLMTGALLATEMEFGDTKVRLHGGGDLRKSAEKLGGYQPYSLQIGDTFYAYNRLDPFGMFLGLASDFRDIAGHVGEAEMTDLVSAATLSFGRNLTSKSYLSGLIEGIEALNEAARGNTKPLKRYFDNQVVAGSMPFVSAFNVARKVDDPVMREVYTTLDAVKNKIPGFSSELPPMLNLFGEEVLYKGGLGPDIASPITTTEASSDKAASEIARLNIDLQPPARSIGGIAGAPNIELSPTQYHAYALAAGKKFKELATKTVESPRWDTLPSDPQNTKFVDAKEKTMRLLHEAAKRHAYAELLKNDPAFKAAVLANGKEAVKALTTFK